MDNLDVLSKARLIRDFTQVVLDAEGSPSVGDHQRDQTGRVGNGGYTD